METTTLGALGEVLPLAVGVAFSPLPIIAVILVAMGERGRAAAIAFALGRVLGLTLVTAIVVLASDVLYAVAGGGLPTIVKVVLGAALIVLGVTKWRPKPGGPAPLPGWMRAVSDASPARAVGFGALVTVANPKELALLIAAGTTIGATALSPSAEALVGVGVVLVASLTTLLPALAVLIAPTRVRPALEAMRTWLTANHGVVMGILLVVIGAVVLGGGRRAYQGRCG